MNTSSNTPPNQFSNHTPTNYSSVARTPVTSEPTGALGTDRLYSLLPAIYRIRDGAVGEPLRALLATLEQEVKAVESDIDALYEDWFIETCAEWVVPYIGELLGVHQLYAEQTNGYTNGYGQQERRAYIANTLAYRRRKGTTPILEQLARDVTGWHAKVVEFGKLVETTQHLDHIRAASATVNLRTNNQLQEIGTPFEQQAAYSAEIRSADQGGRYGLSQIGLFVWRLQSYPMVRSQARKLESSNGMICGLSCYSFHPLGKSVPLFNQPQSETDTVARVQEINLPTRLRRPVLTAELSQRREALLSGTPLKAIRYFDSDPVFQIFVDGQPNPLAPEEILIGDLENPSVPPVGIQSEAFPPPKVMVDPDLGRMAFWGDNLPQQVEVSYHYGFSDDIGGGPYGRNQSSFQPLASRLTSDRQPQAIDPLRWNIRQADTADANPLKTAIETWNQTIAVWQGFQDNTHIPLINLTIPPVIVATTESPESLFSPGIVGNGLRVHQGICPHEIIVSEGVAIDRQGRRLVIAKHHTLDITQLSINKLPQSKGILILTYQDADLAQLQVVAPETIAPLLNGWANGWVIPLATLQVDEQNQRLVAPPDMSIRPEFVSGIVQGLQVRKRPGTLDAWLTAGIAVDSQGQSIMLVENQPITLTEEQGQVRAVLLVHQRQDWRLQLVSLEAKAAMTTAYIHLSTLDIPWVTIDQQTVEKRVLPPEIKRKGLDITTSASRAEIEVSAGSLTQADETYFTLPETVKIDLSAYAGRSLTVFASPRADQGLPLATQHNAAATNQPSAAGGIGVVPVEPSDTQCQEGEIVIGDNATYCGDLPVLITPRRHLKIVAAEGYRPHILGDVQVWAIAPEHPGKLSLNGLLIEGAVHVLPGNLKQLTISHCTLATSKGSITVIEPEPGCPERDTDEEISLIAVLLYGLTILWQLIGQDLGLCGKRSSSLTLTKTMQLVTSRLLQWVVMLERVCQGNQEDWAWESRQEHPQLEIEIDHTLSGPIWLARAVPRLSLQACVIDPGNYDKTSASAITATGTHTHIEACTLLGRTRVRELSATNCLFTQKVTVQQRQTGCVRFCYIPITSRTPRRYQCQPDRTLKKSLTSIPGDVSALFSQGDRVICALSGTGIFQQRSITDEARLVEWRERSGDLSNRYISAIAIHTSPADSANLSTENPAATNAASKLIIGTTNGQLFHTPLAFPTTPQATTNENTEENTEDWRALPFPSTNTPISVLLPDQQPGQGLVTVEGVRVYGQRTAFQHELNATEGNKPGDFISINNSAPRQVVAIGRRGIGELTLQGNQVTSHQLQDPPLTVGDTLTIQQQTRKIIAISETDPNSFILNNSFLPEGLTPETANPDTVNPDTFSTDTFKINNNTELTLSDELDIEITQPVSYTLHQFWVATAGSGPWRISATRMNRPEWESVRTGLSDGEASPKAACNITALIRTRAGELWLGTANAGVFRLSRERQSDSLLETWLPENAELLSHHITTLIEDPQQQLVAGTSQGIFLRPPNSQHWQTVSATTQYNITTLVAYSYDKVNDNIRDNIHVLIAGTTDGKLLQSRDSGNSWDRLRGLDLRGNPITTLTVASDVPTSTTSPPFLYLGTAMGDILRSDDDGNTWQSLHQTIPRMTDKLRILRQLQPAFTTTDSGDPGYCQLTQACAPELRTGSEYGAEMGVFHGLKQPQREANLKASLNDYLRFGLTAGIFYIT